MKSFSQKGFTAVEGVVIVLILALVGFAGYKVYNSHKSTSSSLPNHSAAVNQSPVASVSAAPSIKSTADLDSALKVLDQNDPGATNAQDASQLNLQAAGF